MKIFNAYMQVHAMAYLANKDHKSSTTRYVTRNTDVNDNIF